MHFPSASRLTLAAAAFCFAAFAARADDVQDAAKLLKAGQHQQALDRVNAVLAQKPRDPQARFLKGLIYPEQGNTQDAIEIFQKLTQDFPELPEPYNNLAVIYAAQGQYEKARGALEQSIRTHPSYATAYENLGDVYAKLASQAYDKALQIDSSNAGAQNKLALVRELVGGPPRAKPAVVATAPKEAPKPPEPPKPAVVAAADPKPAAPEKPAPEKLVLEKPAPKAAAGGEGEIVALVNAWAKAWSAKDVDAYFAFYAPDFKTPNGEPREDWEKARRQRISAPKSISVVIEAPKVRIGGDGQASVSFRQGYRSDVLKTSGPKTLVLVKADGRWRIQQERVGN